MLIKKALGGLSGKPEQLIVKLTKLKNDGEHLERDGEGLGLLVQLLLQASEPAAGPEGLTLAGLLLRTSVLGVELEDGEKRMLLESRYVPALIALVDAATAAARARGEQLLPAHEEPLRAVFDALADLASMPSGRMGANGRPARGRELHGTAVLPRLVAFLVLQPADAFLAVKHTATGTLLEYLINSRHNCEQLGAIPDSVRLFGEVMRTCGSVSAQVDLTEALYRCARAGVLSPAHRALFAPDVLAALDTLAARPARDLDLPAELRRLLVILNRAAGKEATVYCLQAKSVAVNNIDGLAAHGRWVDFGLRSVAVGLHTPEGEEEGAGERPPELEIVEFPLADVTRVAMTAGITSGYSKLTVSLRVLPKVLRDMSQKFWGPGTLQMQFKNGDLGGLATYTPKVAAAMKAVGVTFAADGSLLGGGPGGLEMSQRARKVSTGFTVYDRQQPAVQAPSLGRAPLQLMRSGHTPSNSALPQASGAAQQLQLQPTSRPKSILKHSSSPAPAVPAGEAIPAEEQLPEAAGPQVAAEQGGAAAAVAAQDGVPVAAAAAASQPRRRQASQRPAGTATATDTGLDAKRAGEVAGEVNSPAAPPPTAAAGSPSQAAKQRAAAAAAKLTQKPAAGKAAKQAAKKQEEWGQGQGPDEEGNAGERAPAEAAGKKKQKAASQRGGKLAAGGRRKMLGSANKVGAKPARRGGAKPASPEDPIETQTQRHKREASPTPSWMRGVGGDKGGQPLDLGAGSDSESDLQHDHASKQQLFAEPAAKPSPAAAALAAAAAKVAAGTEQAPGKGKAQAKGKAAAPGSGAQAAAAAVRKAVGKAAADWSEESETEAEEAPQPQRQRPAAKQAAAGKAGTRKPAASKPAPSSKPVAGKKAASKKAAAAEGSRRPLRIAAATASAKLATDANGKEEEEEEEGWSDSESEGAPAAQRQQGGAKAPAAAAKGKGKAEVGADAEEAVALGSFEFKPQLVKGKKQAAATPAKPGRSLKSPLKRMQGSGDKLAGQKREREAEAPEETLEELTAAPVAAEPKPAEFGGGADLAEEPEPAADMALEPEPEPEAAGTKAERPAPVPEPAPAGGAADQVQDEGIEVEDEPVQEEEEEEEEEGKEEASEESEEEASEESEEEARPGGYKSEGTRHLAGWTNFRAAEPDVPDMMVPQEELAGITRQFQFTAVKDAPPAGAAPASKKRKKAPAPLLGLSNAKAMSGRLTTTLSQEGVPGLAAARADTATAPRRAVQQQQQPAAAAAGGGKSHKRTLEALGQPGGAAQKRQKAGAAATKPGAAAGGGRGGRKAVTLDDSQALSIHGLLQSAQRRAAAATQPSQPDSDSEDEGMDLATLQAMMLEMVRKRKQAAQRKQAGLVSELEAEVAAALAAQERELAAAQQGLDESVVQSMLGLEKQLDAKMREIDGEALVFQQRLNQMWEEYRVLYDRVSQTAAEIEAAATQQRAAAARGLEQLRAGLAAKAADVGRKIERANKRAGKMPELAQMLAPFLG